MVRALNSRILSLKNIICRDIVIGNRWEAFEPTGTWGLAVMFKWMLRVSELRRRILGIPFIDITYTFINGILRNIYKNLYRHPRFESWDWELWVTCKIEVYERNVWIAAGPSWRSAWSSQYIVVKSMWFLPCVLSNKIRSILVNALIYTPCI